jgi:hypothetical protein
MRQMVNENSFPFLVDSLALAGGYILFLVYMLKINLLDSLVSLLPERQ